jgi:hypothetical protein
VAAAGPAAAAAHILSYTEWRLSDETDRKILKSAQQGYQNPLQLYVPEKQSAAAEIERQLRRAGGVFPPTAPFPNATAAPRCPCGSGM